MTRIKDYTWTDGDKVVHAILAYGPLFVLACDAHDEPPERELEMNNAVVVTCVQCLAFKDEYEPA